MVARSADTTVRPRWNQQEVIAHPATATVRERRQFRQVARIAVVQRPVDRVVLLYSS
jgi:hypothetical protein